MIHPQICWDELIASAVEVRQRAYAPFSHFSVGAALLTRDGRIFQGCNVENASYGLSLCAERSALVSAISQGFREFVAIAIAADPIASPCGACRQFIVEFGDEIEVLSFSAADPAERLKWTSGELLPEFFRF